MNLIQNVSARKSDFLFNTNHQNYQFGQSCNTQTAASIVDSFLYCKLRNGLIILLPFPAPRPSKNKNKPTKQVEPQETILQISFIKEENLAHPHWPEELGLVPFQEELCLGCGFARKVPVLPLAIVSRTQSQK